MKITLYTLVLTLITASCQKNSSTIEILNSEIIQNLPSASGIVTSGDGYYAIGDDSPYLFHLNKDNQIISKFQIYSSKHIRKGRIIKKHKPDFEALEMVSESEMIVIGSGSKSPERDLFLRIFLEDTTRVKSYNISTFYNNLKNSKILKNEELNIEALAFRDGYIHLFNRGRNVIFSFIYKDLIAYFEGLIPFPEPSTAVFNLPKINGIESGFSGATILKNQPFVVFTSSVENTDNAYNDGEILGSFIGTIDLLHNSISNSYDAVRIPNIEKPLKVESVTIIDEITSRKVKATIVTDDDRGNSMKIDCLLEW